MTDAAGLRLREALGHFVTGVTIIATHDGEDPYGLTANSFSSVSLEPPLILFSLSRTADCFDAFEASELFSVNVLHRNQEELSSRFARKDIDKWTGIGWSPGRGGCPLIEGAIATFECRTVARHPGGDHVIYVGEVMNFTHGSGGEPLAFFRGRYADIST